MRRLALLGLTVFLFLLFATAALAATGDSALPDLSGTQQIVAALVGLVLPLALALPIQHHWPPQLKVAFTLLAYGLVGVVEAAAAGKLTGATWWQSALSTFVTGALAYLAIWKPAGVAPAIERATSPGD